VSDPTTWFQPRMVGIKASATALLPTDALDFELVSCLEPRIGLLGVDAQRDRRWLSSGFAASYAATTALAAINPWSWGLPILLVSAGLSMSISNTAANSLLQATVAGSRRGRTISLFMLAMRGGMSIAGLLTGISVGLVGVRYALLINGLMALTTQIIIGRRWTRRAVPVFDRTF
jgi:MFS family permease